MFDKASDLEGIKERVQEAKNKPYKMLERFHVGDIVYPFWLRNMVVYGTVIDIDTVAHKVICDFNGIMRQFCPEDLMLTNPELVRASKTASKKENELNLKCKKCGGEIAVAYDEQKATTDFVCTQCGMRIPEEKLSEKTKTAMRKKLAAAATFDPGKIAIAGSDLIVTIIYDGAGLQYVFKEKFEEAERAIDALVAKLSKAKKSMLSKKGEAFYDARKNLFVSQAVFKQVRGGWYDIAERCEELAQLR